MADFNQPAGPNDPTFKNPIQPDLPPLQKPKYIPQVPAVADRNMQDHLLKLALQAQEKYKQERKKASNSKEVTLVTPQHSPGPQQVSWLSKLIDSVADPLITMPIAGAAIGTYNTLKWLGFHQGGQIPNYAEGGVVHDLKSFLSSPKTVNQINKKFGQEGLDLLQGYFNDKIVESNFDAKKDKVTYLWNQAFDIPPDPVTTHSAKTPEGLRDYLGNVRHAATVRRYTGSIANLLNRNLRRGLDLNKDQSKIHENLQEIFSQTPALKEPIEVYRGSRMDDSFLNGLQEHLESGKPFQDLGYSSASLNQDVAKNFGNFIFKIKARHGIDASFASNIKEEEEILLPPSSYKVLGISKENKHHIVEMEQFVPEKKSSGGSVGEFGIPLHFFQGGLVPTSGGTVGGGGNTDQDQGISLPTGSIVLNTEATKLLEQQNSPSMSFHEGGAVPVHLQPGERVILPHEIDQMGGKDFLLGVNQLGRHQAQKMGDGGEVQDIIREYQETYAKKKDAGELVSMLNQLTKHYAPLEKHVMQQGSSVEIDKIIRRILQRKDNKQKGTKKVDPENFEETLLKELGIANSQPDIIQRQTLGGAKVVGTSQVSGSGDGFDLGDTQKKQLTSSDATTDAKTDNPNIQRNLMLERMIGIVQALGEDKESVGNLLKQRYGENKTFSEIGQSQKTNPHDVKDELDDLLKTITNEYNKELQYLDVNPEEVSDKDLRAMVMKPKKAESLLREHFFKEKMAEKFKDRDNLTPTQEKQLRADVASEGWKARLASFIKEEITREDDLPKAFSMGKEGDEEYLKHISATQKHEQSYLNSYVSHIEDQQKERKTQEDFAQWFATQNSGPPQGPPKPPTTTAGATPDPDEDAPNSFIKELKKSLGDNLGPEEIKKIWASTSEEDRKKYAGTPPPVFAKNKSFDDFHPEDVANVLSGMGVDLNTRPDRLAGRGGVTLKSYGKFNQTSKAKEHFYSLDKDQEKEMLRQLEEIQKQRKDREEFFQTSPFGAVRKKAMEDAKKPKKPVQQDYAQLSKDIPRWEEQLSKLEEQDLAEQEQLKQDMTRWEEMLYEPSNVPSSLVSPPPFDEKLAGPSVGLPLPQEWLKSTGNVLHQIDQQNARPPSSGVNPNLLQRLAAHKRQKAQEEVQKKEAESRFEKRLQQDPSFQHDVSRWEEMLSQEDIASGNGIAGKQSLEKVRKIINPGGGFSTSTSSPQRELVIGGLRLEYFESKKAAEDAQLRRQYTATSEGARLQQQTYRNIGIAQPNEFEERKKQRQVAIGQAIGEFGTPMGLVVGNLKTLGSQLEEFGQKANRIFGYGAAAIGGMVAAASPDAWSTLTGSFRLLSAVIGMEFLPLTLRISGAIQKLVIEWLELNPTIKSNIATWATWGVGIAGGIAVLGKFGTALNGLGNILSLSFRHPLIALITVTGIWLQQTGRLIPTLEAIAGIVDSIGRSFLGASSSTQAWVASLVLLGPALLGIARNGLGLGLGGIGSFGLGLGSGGAGGFRGRGLLGAAGAAAAGHGIYEGVTEGFNLTNTTQTLGGIALGAAPFTGPAAPYVLAAGVALTGLSVAIRLLGETSERAADRITLSSVQLSEIASGRTGSTSSLPASLRARFGTTEAARERQRFGSATGQETLPTYTPQERESARLAAEEASQLLTNLRSQEGFYNQANSVPSIVQANLEEALTRMPQIGPLGERSLTLSHTVAPILARSGQFGPAEALQEQIESMTRPGRGRIRSVAQLSPEERQAMSRGQLSFQERMHEIDSSNFPTTPEDIRRMSQNFSGGRQVENLQRSIAEITGVINTNRAILATPASLMRPANPQRTANSEPYVAEFIRRDIGMLERGQIPEGTYGAAGFGGVLPASMLGRPLTLSDLPQLRRQLNLLEENPFGASADTLRGQLNQYRGQLSRNPNLGANDSFPTVALENVLPGISGRITQLPQGQQSQAIINAFQRAISSVTSLPPSGIWATAQSLVGTRESRADSLAAVINTNFRPQQLQTEQLIDMIQNEAVRAPLDQARFLIEQKSLEELIRLTGGIDAVRTTIQEYLNRFAQEIARVNLGAT